MIKIFKENHNTILIFFIPLILVLIGFSIYRDYGISLDEEISRNNGLVSIKYICDFLFPQYTSGFDLIKNVPELKNYGFDKIYGAFFDILLIAIIEILFQVKDFSEIFYYRHLLNHYLFVISIICFYYICINLFKNNLYCFFGAAILYTSPRIFAESFYNNKDLAFLSFFIFLIFFSIKFIRKPNYYNAFLLSIFSAIAIHIRVVAIYVSILIALFFIIELLMKNKIQTKKIAILVFLFISQFFFLYIIWPFLWEDPVNNFLYIIKTTSEFEWGGYIFYFGEFYKPSHLPWHYLIISFLATTPLLISIIIFGGLIHLSLRFFKRLVNIKNEKPLNDIWRNEEEKIFLFIFFTIFIPVFLNFLHPAIYNSWRHLFFLFPLLILLSIYFINIIFLKFRKKKIKYFINSFLIIILLNNTYNLIILHPFQYIYFNSIFEKKANKLFEIDYWGVSNKFALEEIVKNNIEKDKITIGVASFTNLYFSKKMLNEKIKNKLIISGQNFHDVDFIYNNNYFEVNPKYDDKYNIPENYKKYSEFKKGEILISEFYIKK